MALRLTQQSWTQEHKLTPWLLAAHGLLLQIKTKISETPTDSLCSDDGPQAPEKAWVYLALQPCCHSGNESRSCWLMSRDRFTEESAVAAMLSLSRLFLCRPASLFSDFKAHAPAGSVDTIGQEFILDKNLNPRAESALICKMKVLESNFVSWLWNNYQRQQSWQIPITLDGQELIPDICLDECLIHL